MFKYRFEKRVLKRTIIDKEDNLLRLKFDFRNTWLEWEERKKDYGNLVKEKEKLESELEGLNMIKNIPKISRSKERIVSIESELKKIGNKMNQIGMIENTLLDLYKTIEAGSRMIKELKVCLKNPKLIYQIYDNAKKQQQPEPRNK